MDNKEKKVKGRRIQNTLRRSDILVTEVPEEERKRNAAEEKYL